jgi:regulatory LuxR family protein
MRRLLIFVLLALALAFHAPGRPSPTPSGPPSPPTSPTPRWSTCGCRPATPTRGAEFADAIARVAAGGTALDPEVVAGLLNASRHASAFGTLTGREHDVLALMAEGRSNSVIADRLAIWLAQP